MTAQGRLTWSREPNERGLARVCQAPRGYIGKVKGEVVFRVGCSRDLGSFEARSWYWCGLDRNSASEGKRFATKEEARDDAKAYWKSLAKAETK